jgi:two-component system phosphate regulon sensor histidine kinase PhoR
MNPTEKRPETPAHLLNPRAVALLLAICVSTITLLFLSLVEGVGIEALLVAGALSFSSCFMLVFVTLKFLIFNELSKIYEELVKLRSKDKSKEKQMTSPLINTSNENNFLNGNQEVIVIPQEKELPKQSNHPIRRINQEIVDFASSKEEELERLRKMEVYRREFLADVSHELKTPIFAAQGYILTLLDGAMDDAKVRHKFLKKAAKSLNSLNTLVQDLLTISQLESGFISMKPENFDFSELVQDVFDQLEHKGKKRKVKLRTNFEIEVPCMVYADRSRLTQVMINLVANAIKYHKLEGGWVRVTLRNSLQHPEEITIEVSDNGMGIAHEHHARIFERFYRVDKSRSKKQGGTGLGLAIVKHILESHHTKINVESALEVGTTFTFRLKKGIQEEEIIKEEVRNTPLITEDNIENEQVNSKLDVEGD